MCKWKKQYFIKIIELHTLAPALRILCIFSFVISISLCLISSTCLVSVTTTWTPICNLCFCKLKSKNAIFACTTRTGIACEAREQFRAKPSTSSLSKALYKIINNYKKYKYYENDNYIDIIYYKDNDLLVISKIQLDSLLRPKHSIKSRRRERREKRRGKIMYVQSTLIKSLITSNWIFKLAISLIWWM